MEQRIARLESALLQLAQQHQQQQQQRVTSDEGDREPLVALLHDTPGAKQLRVGADVSQPSRDGARPSSRRPSSNTGAALPQRGSQATAASSASVSSPEFSVGAPRLGSGMFEQGKRQLVRPQATVPQRPPLDDQSLRAELAILKSEHATTLDACAALKAELHSMALAHQAELSAMRKELDEKDALMDAALALQRRRLLCEAATRRLQASADNFAAHGSRAELERESGGAAVSARRPLLQEKVEEAASASSSMSSSSVRGGVSAGAWVPQRTRVPSGDELLDLKRARKEMTMTHVKATSGLAPQPGHVAPPSNRGNAQAARRRPRTPSQTAADRTSDVASTTRKRASDPFALDDIVSTAPPPSLTPFAGFSGGVVGAHAAHPTAPQIPQPISVREAVKKFGRHEPKKASNAETTSTSTQRLVRAISIEQAAQELRAHPRRVVETTGRGPGGAPPKTVSRAVSSSTTTSGGGGVLSRGRSDLGSSRCASPVPHDPLRGPDIDRRFVLTSMPVELAQKVGKAVSDLGQRAAILECAADAPPPRSATHIVVPDRPRSVKALCGVVAGMWICTPEYVFDSAAAGCWLDEEREQLLRAEVLALSGRSVRVNVGNAGIRERLAMIVAFGGGQVADEGARHSAGPQEPPAIEITSGDDLLRMCLPTSAS